MRRGRLARSCHTWTVGAGAQPANTRCMRCVAVIGLLGLVGVGACVWDDEKPVPTGPTYQYVVGEISIPGKNSEARQFALDLNNDRSPDNQLGMVFGTLQGEGFGVGETATEALLRGNAILLVELQTEAFDETTASGLRTYLGANPDPAACLDPTMLATCGRHLMTRAHYDVVPDTGSELGVAPFEDDRLLAPVSTLPITIGIDPAAPLRLDLHSAEIQLTDVSADGATAVIAGAITKSDRDNIVIPEVARNVARIFGNDCDPAAQPRPCGCPPDSRGDLLQDLFDGNNDCTITVTEVATNSLVESLLYPDLGNGSDAMLSFGFGARLVPAAY